MIKDAVLKILDEVEQNKLERKRQLLENVIIYKKLLKVKETFMRSDIENFTPDEINDIRFKILENLLLFKIEIRTQKWLPVTKEYLDLYKLYELFELGGGENE